MVRAVFFDIDGTLVSFKTHRMPESTRKALEALRGQGMKLFISTGRHELLIDNVDKLRGCDAYFSVIISAADEKLYRTLGINVCCEPKYEQHRYYHK